jgi:type IV pilus assembly protein PilY1
MTNRNRARQTSMRHWRNSLVAVLLGLGGAAHAQDLASQQPLSAGGNVPGNLVLTPSVEWPTLVSVANIQENYSPTETYVGYFDSEKCYLYNYSATEANRYFYPTSMAAAGRVCSSALKQWSGNFMNWATTQTIDPFRKALTGGFRSTDTVGTTILQKAHHSGQGGTGIFPDRTVDVPMASNATPATGDFVRIRTRISGRGHQMTFGSRTSLDLGGTPIAYDPSVHTLARAAPHNHADTLFIVSIRVKVCDPGVGVEGNCVQ